MSHRALTGLIAAERRRQRTPLMLAAVCAVGCAASSVGLFSLSGRFITAAALAGAAGTAMTFNYLLPATAIRGLAIVRTAGRYGERLESHRAALGALAGIRAALYRGLASAPPAQALAMAAGEASARLVQDVGALEIRLVRQSALWAAGATLAAGLGLTALANVECAAATAGFFLASVAAPRLIAWIGGRRSGQALQQASGRLKAQGLALLAAAPELTAYQLQDWAADRIAAESHGLCGATHRLASLEGAQTAVLSVLSSGAVVCVLLLAKGAPLPLAALAALGALATMEGAAVLARGALRDGAAGEAERRLAPFVAAGVAAWDASAAGPSSPKDMAVTLRRPDGGRLTLARGDRLAVIGRSGAGKSTLLEKLVRLHDAEPGDASLGGVDLVDLAPQTARAAFAYAAQSTSLLSDTVADNLRLGAPDADDAALWSALFDAGLDRRIASMPHGLATQVGEGGERLSGGERRRLNLARALLKAAPWLVLDEPTEGLDARTEALVVERLGRRLQRTRQGLILVSHRPAALALCSQSLALVADVWSGAT